MIFVDPPRALTEHFTWSEVTRSPTATARGIDNQLPDSLVHNVERMAAFMEQVRLVVRGPIRVTSWYRSAPLNTAIGGQRTSAHLAALAVDWVPYDTALEAAFERVAASTLDFDQLIHEATRDGARWIHVGLTQSQVSRRDVLRASGMALGGPMSYRRVHAA